MNNIIKNIKTLFITSLLVCFTGISQISHADIGLPDSPLLLGSSVPPNIFFALDDSGSMDWGTLVPETNGVLVAGGVSYVYTHTAPDNATFLGFCTGGINAGFDVPPEDELISRGLSVANTLGVWRSRNPQYNTVYYNPAITYTPWAGNDSTGVAYTDAVITAARYNPFLPGVGTVDLTANDPICVRHANLFGRRFFIANSFFPARYYTFVDDNGDGLVGTTETHTLVEIRPTTPSYTGSAARSDCVAAPVCSYAEEIQNFANWYSYNRRREFVMKVAISKLIDDSIARMGLATINNNDSVATAITDMTVQANKNDLLDALFQVNSSGGTPLRTTLENVGRYFDDTDGVSGAGLGLSSSDASPILSQDAGGECQQNFNIFLTDGFYNGSNPGVGNTDTDGFGSFDGGPHADNFANTLADVAMRYYEDDLSFLQDKVPESNYTDPTNTTTYLDDNTAQHLSTYTVSLGLTGSGLTTPADHDTASAPPWPQPVANTSTTLDDLQHAAFNGRGPFLNAGDSQALIDALNKAIGDIDQRTGASGAALSVNSTALQTTSLIFQASFESVNWTGELTASSLNADGTINLEVWKATSNLGAVISPDNRDIFTSITDSAGNTTGIEFDDDPTNADLDAAIGTLTVGATTHTAKALIQYISGVQADEGTGANDLRVREEILGDIAGSAPISIGPQDLGYESLPGTEGTDYLIFLETKVGLFTDGGGDPQTAVYVGANDGMLHAFHDSQDTATDGSELFAYIPSSLHASLSELADPTYGHEFFVNGTQTVGDACFGPTSSCTWKSILVGTLGEGGRTVYALDVTDPFTFDETDVLWEYNFDDTRTGTTNSAGMGFIKGAPQIVRLSNGEWGVVFGNGYNSDNVTPSDNNHSARLFILDVEDGTEIKVIDTKIGDVDNENGMATPLIVDVNNDRIADTIYSGDLFGNLFKFDISSANESSWETVFTESEDSTDTAFVETADDAAPLFRAKDKDGVTQAITTKPTIVVNTFVTGSFNIIFGTGKYIESSDTIVQSPYQTETIYSILDDDQDIDPSSQVSRTELLEQTITAEFVDPSDPDITFRLTSDNLINYSGSGANKGWYLDLLPPSLTAATANGERIIADPLARLERAIFTTFIPPGNPCDQGGSSFLMELDTLSGALLDYAVFDVNGDGILDALDLKDGVYPSGISIPVTLAPPIVISLSDPNQEAKLFSGAGGGTTTVIEAAGGISGRQSWRQIQ